MDAEIFDEKFEGRGFPLIKDNIEIKIGTPVCGKRSC